MSFFSLKLIQYNNKLPARSSISFGIQNLMIVLQQHMRLFFQINEYIIAIAYFINLCEKNKFEESNSKATPP